MNPFRKVKTTGVVFLFLFFALALTLFAFFRLSPVYEGNSTMGATSCLSSTGQEFLRCNSYCIDTVRNTPDDITKMRFTECIHSTPYQYKLPTTAPPTTTPFKTTPPTTTPFKTTQPTTTPFKPANISVFNMNSNSGSTMRGVPTITPVSCPNGPEQQICICANRLGFDYRKGPQRTLSPQEMQSLNECMRPKMGGVQTTKVPFYLGKGPCSLLKANTTEYAKCKDYCYSSFQPGTQEFGKCMF
jgi:hypothetical protein